MKKEQTHLEKLKQEEFMKWLETQPIRICIQTQRKSDDITDEFYNFIIDVIFWIVPRRYKCLVATILFIALVLFIILI
ncbi:MAG: hypothetical protein FWC41_05175 [Firmicutes bacterium]|nr:hypothetical protein [Bacillota bacterium]